jgi:4-oxalocrotonate tautomerase
MPHIIVKMYPGRSEEQKTRLTEAIVKDVVAITNVGDDAVSVTIEEIRPNDWADKVYRPDIVNSAGGPVVSPDERPSASLRYDWPTVRLGEAYQSLTRVQASVLGTLNVRKSATNCAKLSAESSDCAGVVIVDRIVGAFNAPPP